MDSIGFDSILVSQMVDNNIEFSVRDNAIYVDGFYKSWAVRLEYNPRTGVFTSFARWDDVQIIKDIIDLINLNLKWQDWSSKRGVIEWETVSEPWATLAHKYEDER